MNCGREIEQLGVLVRCDYCGGRRLLKKRPSIPREVSTD